MKRLLLCAMWLKHYSTLVHSFDESVIKDSVLPYLDDFSNEYAAMNISIDNIGISLRQAKLGKYCGVDGLSAKHFIYASNYAKITYLSILFIFFIQHGDLPNGMMEISNYHSS